MLKSAEIHKHRMMAVGVIVSSLLVFVLLFFGKRADHWFDLHETIRADFRMITGLRPGSPVQLAGVEVGFVARTDFVKVNYECDPLTEDVGRYGAGRTNDCDDFMFCAPNRQCAELEPFAGKGQHARCDTADDCAEDEVCLLSELRRHAPRVFWSGPLGVCSRFVTEHWRTRVQMSVRGNEETLSQIRTDSRAMIAANSILGDQLVNISPGRGDPLDEDGHIQTRTSLYEDIDRLRARIDSATENADDSLLAIVTLINELKDERFLGHLTGTLYNIEVITRDVAYGDGLVGALMNSPGYKSDVGETVAALERTGRGLETAATQANRIVEKVDRNVVPVLGDAESTLESIHQLLVDLDDPTNRSVGAKLLRDRDGDLAEDLIATVRNTKELTSSIRAIAEAIDDGDGTLGKLINDPTLRHDLGKLLSNIADRKWLQRILIWYLEREGIADVRGSRSPSRPRPRPRPARGTGGRPR